MVVEEKEKPPIPDPLKDSPPTVETEPLGKKKTGRPRKADLEAKRQAEIDAAEAKKQADMICAAVADALPELVSWPFDVVAARRGEHWKISTDEKRRLSNALAPVVNKYLPDWLTKYPEELILAVVTLMIVGPRYKKDKEIEAKNERERTRSPGPTGQGQKSPTP